MRRLPHRVNMVFENVYFRTGRPLIVRDSIDITNICLKREEKNRRVILDYGQHGVDGIFVRVVNCDEDSDSGASCVVFLTGLEELEGSDLNVLYEFAKEFGMSLDRLMVTVKSLAPPLDRTKLIEDLYEQSRATGADFEQLCENAGVARSELVKVRFSQKLQV